MGWLQAGRCSGQRPRLSNVVEIVWIIDVPQLGKSLVDVKSPVTELDCRQATRPVLLLIQESASLVQNITYNVELGFMHAEH